MSGIVLLGTVQLPYTLNLLPLIREVNTTVSRNPFITTTGVYNQFTLLLPDNRQLRILYQITLNDNLPMIQDYPMQVFVL